MRKSLAILAFMALGCGSLSAQTARMFNVKLWPEGMPNTNGIDRQPEDIKKANYQPEIRVYIPQNATGRTVIACPGGGYTHLALDNEGYNWAPYFNAQGITYIVLKYRMPHGNREVPLSDGMKALKMAHDSAAVWHINPNDIGIMGSSAGGHLASTLATHTDADLRPDFQILFYPVISMDIHKTHQGSVKGFLGKDQNNKEWVKEFSNDQHVRRHITPPTILLLSNDDEAVPPVTNAIAYYSALRKNSVYTAMHVYPVGGHGWGFSKLPCKEDMLEDLTDWLKALPSPKQDAVRVACVGNSITDGSGLDMKDPKAYPGQLQQLLGQGYIVRNYGVSGRTQLANGNAPYIREYAWKDCLKFNPQVVVVKLGSNDSKPWNWDKYGKEYRDDLQKMVDELKALPSKPRILLAYPIKAFDGNRYQIRDSVIVNGIIPVIKKVAKKNKLQVIDLHTPFEGHEEYLQKGDGVHPNPKGAKVMAEIVKKALLEKK